MAFNGTTAEDFRKRPRYFVQWVTEHDKTKSGAAQIVVLGYCIRDQQSPNWDTVFEHADKEVCEKLANILNEGA
jgi:hypothetical protein